MDYSPTADNAMAHPSSQIPKSSSSWEIPSQLFVTGNHQASHKHPNPLAFWHNPHILQPSSNFQDGLPHSQIPSAPTLPEQKKHKRTRSGCFTCRARRVKCDETRPVCDRCSKGKRECAYPSLQVSRAVSRINLRNNEKYSSIPESQSEDDSRGQDTGDTPCLGSSHEGQARERSVISKHPEGSMRIAATHRRRGIQSLSRKQLDANPDVPSSTQSGSSPSNTTDVSTGSHSPGATTNTTVEPSPLRPRSGFWDKPRLTDDIQFFLTYRKQHITPHHYMLKSHAAKFINEDLVKYAFEYEPLLYAIVAFTAYHYSIAHPNGKIYTFLQYYNRSVSSLLKSLKAGDKHCDAMLLTILQLAIFEEFVGDWVNLIDHHHGAHRMLVELHTPKTINEDDFHRHILLWHSRHDVMTGLMAGNSAILSREWYLEAERATSQDSDLHPYDISKKVCAWSASNRRFAMDMASLVAKMSQGLLSENEFRAERQMLNESIESLKQSLESMVDCRQLITSSMHQKSLGAENSVDPNARDSLFEVNLCCVEFGGGMLMCESQMGMMQQQVNHSELQEQALELCRMIESMDRSRDKPAELPLLVQSPAGLACVFLPFDDTNTTWCRKMLARIESQGYIFPPSFRSKLADRLKLPDSTSQWWLSNDDVCPRLIREIREWTEERTTNPRDTFREAVQDIRSLFGKMSMDDTSSQASSPSTYSGIHHDRSSEYSSP